MGPYTARMSLGDRSLRPWAVCLLVLGIGVAANFQGVWREPSLQKLVGVGDSHRYFGPQASYMDWAVERGELPLWSPVRFCGQPFAANPQAGVFYPLNLARSVLTSDPTPARTHVGSAILAVLHILIAGLGTFALARAHGLTVGASLVSAWGFGFGAGFVRRVLGGQFLGVVAWVPWILLALHWRSDGEGVARSVPRTLVAGCLFGVSLLGGFPQMSIYIGLGLAAYVLVQRLGERPHFELRPLVRDVGTLGLVAVTGALVAAPMLLPAIEFVARSSRVDPAVVQTGALAQVSQYGGMGDLFDALVKYPGQRLLGTNYRACGAGILILAVVGLLHPRRCSVATLVVLFLAFLDCSLGPPMPLATLLSKVISSPLINPSRGFILACLPLALLAGLGVDALRLESSQRVARRLRTGFVLVVGVTVLAGLAQKHGSPSFLGLNYGVVVVPGLLCCALIAKLWWRAPWSAVILFLIGTETVIWNGAFVPHTLESSRFDESVDSFSDPRELPLDNRRFGIDRYSLRPTVTGYDPLQLAASRSVLCAAGDEGVYSREIGRLKVLSSNQRGNLFLKRPFWLARQFVRGPLPGKRALFPVATTAFLETSASLEVPEIGRRDLGRSSVSRDARARAVAGPEDLEWRRSGGGKQWRLMVPEFSLPRAQSALRLRYRSSTSASISVEFQGHERVEPGFTLSLRGTNGDPGVIELPLADFDSIRVQLSTPTGKEPPQILAAQVLTDHGDEDRLIKIREWGANSVTVQVGPLEGHRLLTFVDAAYPGWSATVDGEPAPLFLAADAFKAVEVPPGTHEVRFIYSSGRVWAGLAISLATLASCGLLVWRTRRKSIQVRAA